MKKPAKKSSSKATIQKIDMIADKALGPKEQLRDAAKIKAKQKKKK